jgi:hypothetical protein
MNNVLVQLTPTQQTIITLHEKIKGIRKRPHTIEEEKELSSRIFEVRRQLIAELYPKE